MTYTDEDINDYNEYMDFIREHIIKETKEKFKLKIKEHQIELGHIKMDDPNRWVFYYTILNDYKDQFEVWKGSNKRSCMTKQVDFSTWQLIRLAEERDKKLTQLGI